MIEHVWATNFSPDGRKYYLWGKLDLMRIPPNLIKSVFYIYSSEEAAKNGYDEGACGFLIIIPDGEIRENGEVDGPIYAVTNCHVIGRIFAEYKTPHIRINSDTGPPLIMALPEASWHRHPDGDDIAAALISIDDDQENIYVQNVDQLVMPAHLRSDNRHVGPGDSVFMVGRFVLHDGKKANTPVVRYGNISLNPGEGELIHNGDTGHEDEVFLVESRSVSGYSGSPVYVYIIPYDLRSKPKSEEPQIQTTGIAPNTHMLLLGVNIGNTAGYKQVLLESKDGKSGPFRMDDGTTLWSEYNTGMMRIAPAWKIRELLDIEEFKMAREKRANKHFELDSKREEIDMSPISRQVFMKGLE